MLEERVMLLGGIEVRITQIKNTRTLAFSIKPLPSTVVKEKMKFTWLVARLVVTPRVVADQVDMDSRDGERSLGNAISQVMIFGRSMCQTGVEEGEVEVEIIESQLLIAARKTIVVLV
jgi:hypothetical protein